MAIMTRCSMPPDSSAGIWWNTCSGWCRPTAVNSSTERCLRGPAGQAQLHPQHLGQLVAHGDRRVQVGGRVLEHRTHVAAVHALPAAPGQGGQVVPGERHRPLVDGDAGGQHAERGPAGQRLAAAGLPHQPDDLPGPDAQRDAADGGGRPVCTLMCRSSRRSRSAAPARTRSGPGAVAGPGAARSGDLRLSIVIGRLQSRVGSDDRIRLGGQCSRAAAVTEGVGQGVQRADGDGDEQRRG